MVTTYMGRLKPAKQQTLVRSVYTDSTVTSAFSRNSGGTTIDQYGNVLEVGNNVPRRLTGALIGRNMFRNPWMLGARLPTTDPSFWSVVINPPFTEDVVRYGVEDGIPFMDARGYGRNNGAVGIQHGIFFETSNVIPVTAGEWYTLSFYMTIIAGSKMGLENPQGHTLMQFFSADGTQVGYTVDNLAQLPMGGRLKDNRLSISRVAPATAAWGRGGLLFNSAGASDIDLTIRIGGPQYEPGTVARDLVLPALGKFGPTTLYRDAGIAIEAGRTNLNTNSIAGGINNTGAHTGGPTTEIVAPYAAAEVQKRIKGVSTDTNFCNSGGGTFPVSSQLVMSIYAWLPVDSTATNLYTTFDSGTAVTATRSYDMTRKGTWQRIWRAMTSNAVTPNHGFQVRADGMTEGGIMYLAMPQLEFGATPTSWIPTSGGQATRDQDTLILTLGSEYRNGKPITNLLGKTQEFDDAYWSKTNVTVTANATAGPAGDASAEKTVELANGDAVYGVNRSAPLTEGMVHTFSVLLKAGERTMARVGVGNGETDINAFFNLSTGQLLSIATNNGRTYPNQYHSITPFGNGWYKCAITFIANASRNVNAVVRHAVTDGGFNVIGVAGQGLFITAAQFALGGPDTLYVYNPTTTPLTYTPVGPLTTVLTATVMNQSPDFQGVWALDDETFNNRLYCFILPGTNDLCIQVASGGVYNGPYFLADITFGEPFTLAIAVTETGVRYSVNGATVAGQSFSVPLAVFTKRLIGSIGPGVAAGTALNGGIEKFEVVPFAMTDTQLRGASI